ncbi:hypothetical protein J2X65_003159 [Ancylobacter sp. 3268]|uniref:hypothetical protein n=1 Tax=Ancylobacter sp. 3268 TaxID=2817752 RepID=UPI0028561872|nr:hypothetical protein [Ancylobacter sp. 3268]MDR6953796.1 hypothetical protein [Ancylobacter sp. 3268]
MAEPSPRRLATMSFLWDIVGLSGAGLVVGGIAMMHVPSACIAGGLALIGLAIRGARRF